MSQVIIGVMGPGEGALPQDCEHAYALGQLIAQQDWVLLTGGSNIGVMEAANQGAKASGGLTIGILPSAERRECSTAVDLAIATDVGQGRNNINVLSCDGIIACGTGLGTVSEIALALKNGKRVVLLTQHQPTKQLFLSLAPEQLEIAQTPTAAIALVHQSIHPADM